MSEPVKAPSPYITSRAVDQGRTFFGRDAILQRVETHLRARAQSTLVLSGGRRIGKTSILLQLQRALPSPSFLPVYFDLMGQGAAPVSHLLFDLAAALCREAGLPAPRLETFAEERCFEDRFLPDLFRVLGEECRPVLLLDQLDMLEPDGDLQGAGARAVLSCLRGLQQRVPWLGLVFVVEAPVEVLPVEAQALLKIALRVQVPVLDDPPARALVALGRQGGHLCLTRAAEDRLLALASYHPYFIQLLCQALWDLAAARGAQAELDVAAVDEAAAAALAAGESGFSWIWADVPAPQRIVLSLIAHATSRQPQVSRARLGALFERHDVPLLDGQLFAAPRALVQAGLLLERDGAYHFAAELLRRWVAARKPIAQVKQELVPEVPLAYSLYRSARGLSRRRTLGSVPDLLRQALRLDPTLLPARLLLGETLLDQGLSGEAVKEYEEAHRRVPEVARAPLLRALCAHGEERERAGDDEEALSAYERVLELDPLDDRTRERRAAIWLRRGDRAMQEGDLDRALRCYTEAGAGEKAAAIGPLKKQREVEQAVRRAQEHEEQREWAAAIAIYERLAAGQPDEPRWQEAARRAAAEQELARLYAQATVALSQGERHQALRTLVTLVDLRPDYRDAEALLLRAARRPGEPRSPRQRYLGLLGAVALGLAAGSVVTLRAGRPIARPQASAVAAERRDAGTDPALLLLDTALLERRWEDARRMAERVLSRADAPQAVRQVAAARRELAERERQAQLAYERFQAAAGGDPDQALRLCDAVPTGSLYGQLAREGREALAARAIGDHLRRAEAARQAGRCVDFRAHVEKVVALQPDHQAALAARRRPCQEAPATVAAVTRAPARPAVARPQRDAPEPPDAAGAAPAAPGE